MAVKKTVTDPAEEITQTTTANNDPWGDMVTIKLPKAPKGEENFVMASVNGRTFKIKRGVAVDVPAPIAEVIQNSEEMRDEADEYIEKHLTEDQDE